MDGDKAVKILRQRGIKSKIIAITANAFQKDQENALECGFNDFIPKPFDFKKFKKTINKNIA